MKPVLAGSCALALFACSPPGQPAPPASQAPSAQSTAEVFTFECANGKSFSVTYDEGFTVATVQSGGATYKLPAVMAASGSRYSDGKVEYWEHHGEALLHGIPGGPYDGCPEKNPA